MNYSLPRPIFNVRIYGILIENDAVLISDEIHTGTMITKFPGGGLQFGEGTRECLKREFMEELNIEITVTDHFYTVDFFQASAFDPTQQVICIYYMVASSESGRIPVTSGKADFESHEDGAQHLRWVPKEKLSPGEFTFPVDKKVSELLGVYLKDYKSPLS
jgi:8-oxo-dGTP diphosphatase